MDNIICNIPDIKKCLICGSDVTENGHFWSNHKIKQSDYYQQFFPRNDLFTNEIIPFKSIESYFLSDFKDKINLKKYLKLLTKEESLIYLQEWLGRRKQIKKLKFAPSEFEIKTLTYPSISFINKNYGDGQYENICKKLNLINLYSYNSNLFFNENENIYLCDTREQNRLNFKKYEIQTLKYGDYSVKDSRIFIERKSLSDFLGTMSNGYDRFCKEIEKCKSDNNYLIILIEDTFANLRSFEYLKHIHSKCSFDFVSHRIRELLYKYQETIQFVCGENRKKSVEIINKIFNAKFDIRNIDIQYYLNINKF